MEDLREEYGELLPERTTVLAEALERIYAKTDKQFIFLIDEWDCVMRERKEAEDLQRHYLDFLRDLLKRSYFSSTTSALLFFRGYRQDSPGGSAESAHHPLSLACACHSES